MSRDNFEEFLKQNSDALFWNTSDAMFKAWLAGRESMRDEAKKKSKTMAWECNECGSQEYTMAVSASDVQNLGCGNCGANEWHEAEERP